MSRPIGVTASAVVSILCSVLVALFGVLILFAPMDQANAPPFVNMRVFAIAMSLVLLGLATLGIWTGVDLVRQRPWARMSILVFAGCLAALCLLSMVVVASIPLNAPGIDPAVARVMHPVLLGVYAVPLSIGVWWLVQFNTAATKAAFLSGVAPAATQRPLSISIIGWWTLVGGAFCVFPAFTRLPVFVAGAVITGVTARLVYLAMAAVTVYAGWGLLALRERARLVAVAWYSLTILNVAIVYVTPGARDRLRQVQESIQVGAPPTGFDPVAFGARMMVGAAVLAAVAISFLIREKSAFARQGDQPGPAAA